MKKIVLAVLILGILGLGAKAFAQTGENTAPPKRQMNNPMMKVLNLTEEQQGQIKELGYEHQKKMLDFKNSVEKNRLEMRKVMGDKPLNENKILDLTSANSKIQSDMKAATVKHFLSIYKLLNDDQKDIFVKKFGQMAGMRDHKKSRINNFRKNGKRGDMDGPVNPPARRQRMPG